MLRVDSEVSGVGSDLQVTVMLLGRKCYCELNQCSFCQLLAVTHIHAECTVMNLDSSMQELEVNFHNVCHAQKRKLSTPVLWTA